MLNTGSFTTTTSTLFEAFHALNTLVPSRATIASRYAHAHITPDTLTLSAAGTTTSATVTVPLHGGGEPGRLLLHIDDTLDRLAATDTDTLTVAPNQNNAPTFHTATGTAPIRAGSGVLLPYPSPVPPRSLAQVDSDRLLDALHAAAGSAARRDPLGVNAFEMVRVHLAATGVVVTATDRSLLTCVTVPTTPPPAGAAAPQCVTVPAAVLADSLSLLGAGDDAFMGISVAGGKLFLARPGLTVAHTGVGTVLPPIVDHLIAHAGGSVVAQVRQSDVLAATRTTADHVTAVVPCDRGMVRWASPGRSIVTLGTIHREPGAVREVVVHLPTRLLRQAVNQTPGDVFHLGLTDSTSPATVSDLAGTCVHLLAPDIPQAHLAPLPQVA